MGECGLSEGWAFNCTHAEGCVDTSKLNEHLSQIQTHWTEVFQAHHGPSALSAEALAALVQRYGGAVHRYLLASVREVDAADELSQEFALRFLRGDFKRADPNKGRFRDFLKCAVYHLMVDYFRARRAQPLRLGQDVPDPAAAGDDEWAQDLDRQFLECWREHLMAHAWTTLERVQQRTGRPFADVLRLRVARPELHSPELAAGLSERLGRPVNAGWVRLNLHRARDIFVGSLLGEVEQSLGTAAPQRLEEELSELGLLEYCRSALRRRGHEAAK
jgi:RNA polymerase sigma-70 factor (ECF subfamily)